MSSPPLQDLLLLLHFAATLYMVGLIWFVQRVHYPLLARVGADGFAPYEREHVARTTPVVGPPMLIEAAAAAALVPFAPAVIPLALRWASIALLGAIWASTALLQVPRHRELERGFDARAHKRLVASNWIRTAGWSARGALAWWMVLLALADGSA